ncbi:MAG: hypothetical protein JXA42_11670 [Anaerolineales bacterium]|nr:hypothetical protein [Anaerolineales bacterium]
MKERSKKTKRMLREWMKEAYERELHRELVRLDKSMAEWRQGAISSGEMSVQIREWERGPLRVLNGWYNEQANDLTVAYAVAAGILDETEVPPELLETVVNALALFRSLKEQGELRERQGEWWIDKA